MDIESKKELKSLPKTNIAEGSGLCSINAVCILSQIHEPDAERLVISTNFRTFNPTSRFNPSYTDVLHSKPSSLTADFPNTELLSIVKIVKLLIMVKPCIVCKEFEATKDNLGAHQEREKERGKN